MPIPFEPTRSYVYNAARYELLPRIAEITRDFGGEPFLLREISKRLLAETYTLEQLEIRVKKAKSDVTEKVSAIFGHYIPFLAEELKVFENLGGGMFRNISIEEEIAEADAVATDIESDDAGTIYAYSFPSIIRKDAKFPIKVGLTATGDAKAESHPTMQADVLLRISRRPYDMGSPEGRCGRKRHPEDARSAWL